MSGEVVYRLGIVLTGLALLAVTAAVSFHVGAQGGLNPESSPPLTPETPTPQPAAQFEVDSTCAFTTDCVVEVDVSRLNTEKLRVLVGRYVFPILEPGHYAYRVDSGALLRITTEKNSFLYEEYVKRHSNAVTRNATG